METITEHLKAVNLVEISIGKTNPRNEFNEQSIQELAESIKEKGLLQPLLVRPSEKGYELVCGERRLRACKLINLESVPVQIKELSDQEALEAQIIENLEREDVHPLREAETFKMMIEKGNYHIGDIATKIAKSEKFILQRLSLNNLNAPWKKLFYKNKINLSKALIIARLDKKYQKEVAQNAGDWSGGIKSAKQLQSYIDSNITALLSKAVFDPKDEKLFKRAGACVNCPKRSGANSSLFPDVKEADRCFDKVCFETKTQKYIEDEIVKIYNNAENVHLIKSKHQDIDEGLSENLKKLGVDVLVEYNDFETVYGKDKRKNKIQGFWIGGYNRGQYVPIKLTKKQKVRPLDPKSKESIEAQIGKINIRAKRMLELDAEKVHKRIVEAMSETEELTVLGKHKHCKSTEVINRLIVWNALSWPKKEHYGKLLDIEKYDKEGANGLLKRLEELTKNDMAVIINNVGFDSFKSSLPKYSEAKALRNLAGSFGTIPIEDYEKAQKEIADKRKGRQKERIAKLKKSVKS
ncbi:ParB/RepB/Spo0J family partition protein [Jejuia pallidilutea]|uniref:ParB/RepB/Spo0J family partition protein n=1 Tax=Jejuia pallidilutea TaxID=504487 RepID=A0A362X3J9_9FLAO|nr:ParB/RepB/Spo0J family partition protein [Jejuia pallidilutea]PQV48804.1 ParB/RepB/Spo0J family partition protein [Jejuia pallidilutea]